MVTDKGIDTCSKWNDDDMIKIKVNIAHNKGISKCILISPKGIRAEIVRFMVASYYMFALADYVICDAFGYTFDLDPDYKLTNKCDTMFMHRCEREY
jgi:hypothetical protein